MASDGQEAILRITSNYVDAVKAGRRPRLSDYLARYPQYADEIADFVAYYHAVEVDLPEEREVRGSTPDYMKADRRSPIPQKALQGDEQFAEEITTLFVTADEHYLTVSAMARALDVSADIVRLLEARMIEPTSIPAIVPRKLASLLHYPITSIQSYLARPAQRATAGSQTNQRQKVAEKYLWYADQELHGVQKRRFREVVAASEGLSAQQKANWLVALEREQLA